MAGTVAGRGGRAGFQRLHELPAHGVGLPPSGRKRCQQRSRLVPPGVDRDLPAFRVLGARFRGFVLFVLVLGFLVLEFVLLQLFFLQFVVLQRAQLQPAVGLGIFCKLQQFRLFGQLRGQ